MNETKEEQRIRRPMLRRLEKRFRANGCQSAIGDRKPTRPPDWRSLRSSHPADGSDIGPLECAAMGLFWLVVFVGWFLCIAAWSWILGLWKSGK